MLACVPACCFSRKLLCFPFFRSLKGIQRAMRKVAVVNRMILYAKAPRREALASDNLALPLIFFNLLR